MRLIFSAAAALCLAFPVQAAEESVPRASAGATQPAEAANPAPRGSLFDRLDTDRDGYLTREEMDSDEARKGNWISSDRDNDGRISRAEFTEIGGRAGRAQAAGPRR
jgi:hypothetical protein